MPYRFIAGLIIAAILLLHDQVFPSSLNSISGFNSDIYTRLSKSSPSPEQNESRKS